MDPDKGEDAGDGLPSAGSGPLGVPDADGPVGDTGLKRVLLALMTGTTHVVGLVEEDGILAYAGPSVMVHLGYRPEDMVGRHVAEFIHPDDLAMAMTMMAEDVAHPGTSGTFNIDADIAGEYRLLHADGSWVAFEVLRNNFLAEPQIRGILILARPVGARYALDDALSILAYDPDSSNALQKLAEYLDRRMPGTASAMFIASSPPEWIGGPSIGTLLGGRGPWERALSSGQPSYAVLGEPAVFDPVVEAAAREAGFRACWCTPLPIRDPRVYTAAVADGTIAVPGLGDSGGDHEEASGCLVVWSRRELEPPVGYVGVIERVGGLADLAIKRRKERAHLRQMVDFDQVTGALSRAGLESMTTGSESLPRARVLIDLDDFKDVNDQHGHIIGDDVLRVAVKRLSSVLRYQDLLGRLGGDEFLLLVAGGETEAAVAVARRIASVLEDPITVGSISVHVRASMGIAPWDPAASPAEMVERADQAMYAAKRSGKNRVSVWGAAGQG